MASRVPFDINIDGEILVTVAGRDTMSAAMKDAERYQRYTYHRIEPYLGDKVVDIGCAFGTYTAMILGNGGKVLAMDYDAECIENCKSTLGSLNCEFFQGDISSSLSLERIAAFKPDTIVMLQVLEHIREDGELLRGLFRVMPAGGRLIVTVPAFPSLYGPMDSQAGHYRRYTRHSLRSAATESGWVVEKISYYNPIGGAGWWINNRLLKRWTNLNAGHVNIQISLFDKLILPLSSCLDRFTGRVFGQSLQMVASRPKTGEP